MLKLSRNISILQFHNIVHSGELQRLWLPLHAFSKYLSYLKENDYEVISIGHALQVMRKGARKPKRRPISLTFDHGYADFYQHVFPLLKDNAIPATVLISPEKIGRTIRMEGNAVSYLTADQLREIAGGGITVGAYEDAGWNINKIDQSLVSKHIREYKGLLEDILGIEVKYLGVKEGVPSKRIRDRLIATGYDAFLTQCPTHRRPDPYAIGRIQVDDDDFNIFITKVSKTYLFFKDRRSWRYIRKYKLDRVAHHVSETADRVRGKRESA